ncbi:hypothetical protein PO909_029966 [Leuciscus waleckii]
MPSFFDNVVEAMVPVPRPCVRSTVSEKNFDNGYIPHRLECGHGRPLRQGSLEGIPSLLAHQLPRDAGCISGTPTFPSRPQRPSCSSSNRQYVGGLLHKSAGGPEIAPTMQIGTSGSSVVPGQTSLSQSYVYPWGRKCGSRHPVEAGTEARGMETPP